MGSCENRAACLALVGDGLNSDTVEWRRLRGSVFGGRRIAEARDLKINQIDNT